MEELAARFVGTLVSVCAEVVALRLQQIGRQTLGSVAVKEGNGGSHARHRNTALNRFGHHFTPCRQTGFQHAFEIRIGTQETKSGLASYAIADVTQERAADDAAFAPQEGSVAVIQCPIVVFTGFADQHKALCIRK